MIPDRVTRLRPSSPLTVSSETVAQMEEPAAIAKPRNLNAMSHVE